jgi:hypothetical protein
MADEVHVTTSQADAAKMIVERNSANGRPTPEAIRKIAEAQVDPASSTYNRRRARTILDGQTKSRLRAFFARMSSRRSATGGTSTKR